MKNLKIVLTPEKVNKIIVNALASEGKIKMGIAADVYWSINASNLSESKIIVEQECNNE